MAQTTFRLAASKADTPISGDNPSANPASTPGDSSPKAGNTGFLTQTTTKDVLGVVSSPIVSGAFIFASFILLLALITKIKKNKQANFKDSLNKKHYTTRILAFATFLLFAAGVGGTISRFMGVEAAESELTDITTSDTVEASLIETTDDYKLYCGTDQITLNGSSEGGYYLFMYADDDGILPTTTSGITNIASAEDWNGLGTGEWGYYVGDYSADATINPMPLGYSIIDNASTATTAGIIPVTYCAKISKNIEEAEFSTNINYEVLPLADEEGSGEELDFNSNNDDDGDGLPNRLENRYGMNPFSTDSDMDGLTDDDEMARGTDPLLEDTDFDGLYDYSEVALSKDDQYDFNPTSADYDGEIIEYSEPNGETTGIPFTVTGRGNIPLTYIDVYEPGDVDESLGGISGKAYVFNSDGNVTSASITVDTVPNEGTTSDSEDDDVLGVPVSDDFNAEDLHTFSLTFDEENIDENDEITATVANITPIVSNGKVSIPITSSHTTIVAGDTSINSGSSSDDDEVLGAGLLSGIKKVVTSKNKTSASQTSTDKATKLVEIATKAKSFVTKALNATATALKVGMELCKETGCVSKIARGTGALVKTTACLISELINFKNTGTVNKGCSIAASLCEIDGGTYNYSTNTCEGGEVEPPDTRKADCENNGGTWNSITETCEYGGDPGQLELDIGNSFKVGGQDSDSFTKIANFERVLNTDQGEIPMAMCYGINLLARLLKLKIINLNKNQTVATPVGNLPIKLKGMSRRGILDANADNQTVKDAIYALWGSQFEDTVTFEKKASNGVDKFLIDIKGKVKSDPLILSLRNGKNGVHAYNLIHMKKYSGSPEYYLELYDSNNIIRSANRTMTCTKSTCTIQYKEMDRDVGAMYLRSDNQFK